MATIIVGGQVPKKGTNAPKSPNGQLQNILEQIKQILGEYYLVPVAVIVAAGAYLITRIIVPIGIVWWAREIWALILSLLILGGFSAAIKAKSEIAWSVCLLIISMFVYFLIKGYADNNNQSISSGSNKDQTLATPSKEVSIPIFEVGTHTFRLEKIGDETGLFQLPEGNKFHYQISSGDYGYKIVFADGTSYPGSPNVKIPEKEHPVFNIIATVPGQFVRVTVSVE